jgi:uncharacterized protein YraI
MRVKPVAYAAAVVASSFVPCAAFAATLAVATTDLNIRSGPGPEYPVVGAISANGQATIEACIEESRWCKISYRGQPGWAYTQYMQPAGDTVTRRTTVTTTRPAEPPRAVVTTTERTVNAFGVPTITYEQPAETVGVAAPVTPAPVISGTIVDTPVGSFAYMPPAVVPPAPVQTYVLSHPLDPVYLNGEVVVGAGLPPSVALAPVPQSEYEYAYVNRQPVLVEPRTRRIVQVYR